MKPRYRGMGSRTYDHPHRTSSVSFLSRTLRKHVCDIHLARRGQRSSCVLSDTDDTIRCRAGILPYLVLSDAPVYLYPFARVQNYTP